MPRIIIDKDKCKGCLLCISFCPKGLIKEGNCLNKQAVKPVEFEDTGSCSGCTMCAIICPDCCISVWK